MQEHDEVQGQRMRTDPLTFEALRHRVTTIADEGSMVLATVSSSPVASEANDCNVAIMDASGAAIAIGPGISGHGIGCMMTAQYVRSEYATNPGIRPGDMFLANDPYECSRHQACIVLVSPVFHDDALVAWVGAGIHLPDAGGPVPGQVSVGAESIYEEATPMPPMRIVEGGRIRKDIEAEFVIRSRTAQQLSLDLRALIAACERLSRRLHEMCDRHGAPTLTGTFEDIIEFNRAHIARRLAQIPDSETSASIWLDYAKDSGTEYYECRLTLDKRGERITVDLSESSPQAGAVINCGKPGLVSGVTVSLMALLGYGLPLCPEAVLRSVEIRSRPGTFVHAVHPAGCSKATTAAHHAIIRVFNIAVGKLLLGVPELEDHAIAGCSGFLPGTELSGENDRGQRFAQPLLDGSGSTGFGAMPDKDGIDSGGQLCAPYMSIPNVETYEARFPVLYLWRRHETDSGGMGERRGGLGVARAFMPHRSNGALGVVLHGAGCSTASTPGLAGGYPGGTNTFQIARDTHVTALLARGCIPQTEDEFGGEVCPTIGFYQSEVHPGDVLIVRSNGGGGFGDPLRRDPALVAADVRVGAVSQEWAERGYGVALDGRVDEAATERLRAALRRQRVETAEAYGDGQSHEFQGAAPCVHCGEPQVPDNLRVERKALPAVGAWVLPFVQDHRFHAKEHICATCGTLFDVVVANDSLR